MEFLNFIKAKIKLYNNILEWFPFLGLFVTKRHDDDENHFFWSYHLILTGLLVGGLLLLLSEIKSK